LSFHRVEPISSNDDQVLMALRSPHRLLQGVELCLELREPRKLQVEVSTVRSNLLAKLVDHRTKPAILSSLSPQRLLDLRQLWGCMARARHRGNPTVAQQQRRLCTPAAAFREWRATSG
jgi:hypothetical protein